MESLGLLAGGVAHDLNNVLSGIVSYPDLLLLELNEDSQFRNDIQIIKESGEGAAAIVQDHKGYINVMNFENGTTFELFFPITREEISGKDLAIPSGDLKGNGEQILVIDDEESQRDISCKMLATLNYTAKAVASGEQAVEYLKANTVDLILLDMIMDPGINVRETYERIIKFHPNQKAIIVSGFAETDDVKQIQKLGAGQFVKKPLTVERIGLAVKEELAK